MHARRNSLRARRAPWLVTLVDLMTILLTFFVLLFSMTKIDIARFMPLARAFGDAFAGALPNDAAPRLPEVAAVPGDNLSYLNAVLRPAFARQPSLADVQFRVTAQYIISRGRPAMRAGPCLARTQTSSTSKRDGAFSIWAVF